MESQKLFVTVIISALNACSAVLVQWLARQQSTPPLGDVKVAGSHTTQWVK